VDQCVKSLDLVKAFDRPCILFRIRKILTMSEAVNEDSARTKRLVELLKQTRSIDVTGTLTGGI